MQIQLNICSLLESKKVILFEILTNIPKVKIQEVSFARFVHILLYFFSYHIFFLSFKESDSDDDTFLSS